MDRARLAVAADRVQRAVDVAEREHVRAHALERVFAAGDDAERELDALVAVAAHALHGEEARDQEVAVEPGHGPELAAAEDDPPALARDVDRGDDARRPA